MAIFPTGEAARKPCSAAELGAPETDGVLVRPIGGQVYLIEEADLAELSAGAMSSRFSGLISRH